MATTITPPAPYSTVRESVIFGIDRDNEAVAEVRINGYLKLLPKNAHLVNAGHYFEENFSIAPLRRDFSATMQPFAGHDVGRLVDAFIAVDGITSARVPVIYADKRPPENRFMSDMRRRKIKRGEIDELPVFVASPAVVVYGSVPIEVPSGMTYIAFRVPVNAPVRFSVLLKARTGEVLDEIAYEIEEYDGVRLAWINAYGALDYWNFTVHSKSSTKITREKIYTEGGYTTTSVAADLTQTVLSKPMPIAETQALCHIFVSPAVWALTEHETYPVDITSESVTSYEAEKLSSVQVEFRSKIRTV